MRFYTFLCCLLFAARIHAQPYQSIFGHDSTEWHVYAYVDAGYGDIVYKFERDTVVNGFSLKKVKSTYWDSPFFLWEDLNAGKIWYRLHPTGADSLYLDYNLQAGDTIWAPLHDGDYEVDSVYFSGGKKHIRSASGGMEVIEGIGCTAGIWFGPRVNYAEQFLTCVYHDGVCIYGVPDPKYNKCHPFSESVLSLTARDILLSPNPATDRLNIQLAFYPEIKTVYHIVDILGREQCRGRLQFAKQAIDISTLPAGTYILVITQDEAQVMKRFVK